MQKPLTPRQQLECQKLDPAIKRAERAMHEAESAFGKNSPQYVIAEREKDEIVAKMQRITRAFDGAENNLKPVASRVAPLVVRSKRIIKR
jgi:hypothetical protein